MKRKEQPTCIVMPRAMKAAPSGASMPTERKRFSHLIHDSQVCSKRVCLGEDRKERAKRPGECGSWPPLAIVEHVFQIYWMAKSTPHTPHLQTYRD